MGQPLLAVLCGGGSSCRVTTARTKRPSRKAEALRKCLPGVRGGMPVQHEGAPANQQGVRALWSTGLLHKTSCAWHVPLGSFLLNRRYKSPPTSRKRKNTA